MTAPVTVALKPFETRSDTSEQRSALASAMTLEVTVLRKGPVLSLFYRLEGDLSKVVVPPVAQKPGRRDHLWEQTCFELFLSAQLAPTRETPYWEFNLSPAGHWNVFLLQPYRYRLKQESALNSLPITVESSSTALYLAVSVDLSQLIDPARPLRIGISAVVVLMGEKALRETFWSITHPASQPDFHHPDSFAVQLIP
ncbi:MAG: DOMON-like domain-containing protein [Phormidesmis sp.]